MGPSHVDLHGRLLVVTRKVYEELHLWISTKMEKYVCNFFKSLDLKFLDLIL